jgi:hypothetical protein
LCGDTRGPAGRKEGLLADFMDCGLVKPPHGLDQVVESRVLQRRSQSRLAGERFDSEGTAVWSGKLVP